MSDHHFFNIWSAISTAIGAPFGLPAAKNNSNKGTFLEFFSVRRDAATRWNTVRRRSLYLPAICSLLQARSRVGSLLNKEIWGESRYPSLQYSRPPKIRSSSSAQVSIGSLSVGINRVMAMSGKRIQQSIFLVLAMASTVGHETWVAYGSRKTTARANGPMALQNLGISMFASA